MDRFIQYAVAAAEEALADADWHPEEEEDRTGTVIASGVGGINAGLVFREFLPEAQPA